MSSTNIGMATASQSMKPNLPDVDASVDSVLTLLLSALVNDVVSELVLCAVVLVSSVLGSVVLVPVIMVTIAKKLLSIASYIHSN